MLGGFECTLRIAAVGGNNYFPRRIKLLAEDGMRGIDSYTLNTVAGWVLGTGLLVFGLNAFADVIYHAEAPEKPGMVVEVAAQTPAAGGSETGAEMQIADLLATADPEQGKAAARACQACHNLDKGGPHLVGPNLWNVVGRPIAQAEGYAYSDALQAKSGETWTFEALNDFVHNPRGFAPGTKMAYGGMKRDEQRAHLLAYLRTLSDEPQPLPQATTEPAQEAAAEPAQEAAETQETVAEPAEQPAAGEPAAEEPAAGEPAAGEPAAEQPAAGGEAQGIAARIAGVDPEKGKAASRACQACHTFDEGGSPRVGPNLWGIVGKPIAQAEGYAYSDALKGKSGETWTLEALDQFILNPRGFVPGTKMAFGGMKRDEQRLELLAYLRTLGANP